MEGLSMIDLLLRPEVPDVQKQLPTARYRVKRLCEATGQEVVFSLRGLPYGRVQELRQLREDMSLHIVLAGVTDPDLKDPALLACFGGATPVEAVKALLLPGEIEDLARAVERLCGFRRETIDEIKNA